MILHTTTLPARVKRSGEESGVVIAEGQRLRIETSPGGAEVLDVDVPAGKQWVVTVSVSIDETDT